ncbi:hypothetical protein GFS03_04605 [Sulfolobus sp. E5-1-F]|uniref:hypothetical protein n=1 Tax=Saccharolobus sp. E5-1-F TaxID=2663019 RepID=UPI001296C785|nr:hypothetical protein [Sulfolobus sp. E5-1-F]QGA53905.1 hypothetical protein GFS03_04605 [Sulfolobus sp. E5-1-F]
MSLKFNPLSEPISITDPFEATFNEYMSYDFVTLQYSRNIFSVICSSQVYESYPVVFILREIFENAVDAMIENAKDLEETLNTYKKLNFVYDGGYYKIENEGTISERDLLLFGSRTRKRLTLENCCSIGRYGMGLKHAIILALYKRIPIYILTGNHAYSFGVKYDNEIFHQPIPNWIDENQALPVVFRANVKTDNKTIVYVRAEKVDIRFTYPFDKLIVPSSNVLKIMGRVPVYQNGVLVGFWGIPFTGNLCCVSSDPFGLNVYVNDETLKFLSSILREEYKREIAEDMLKLCEVRQFQYICNFTEDTKKFLEKFPEVLSYMIEKISENMRSDEIVVSNDFRALENKPSLVANVSSYAVELAKMKLKSVKVLIKEEY